jgi:hypothetical protein
MLKTGAIYTSTTSLRSAIQQQKNVPHLATALARHSLASGGMINTYWVPLGLLARCDIGLPHKDPATMRTCLDWLSFAIRAEDTGHHILTQLRRRRRVELTIRQESQLDETLNGAMEDPEAERASADDET